MIIMIALGCVATVAAVVAYSSFNIEEEDDALLRRLEKAIETCESMVKSASTEDDWKALSIDVDYIYEKLDSVSCMHPKDHERKEKRKLLVKRVTAIASVVDTNKK